MLEENKAEASKESETIVTKDELDTLDHKLTLAFKKLSAKLGY
jgi:hypothetical protein